MTKPILLAVAACTLAAPLATRAQWIAGVQAGAAAARGDVHAGETMKDDVKLAIPLEVVGGWKLTPALLVGLQGGYGFAPVGSGLDQLCLDTGRSCKSHLWRVAARVEYTFGRQAWHPYAAGLLGWEWLVQRWEVSSSNWQKSSWSGWLAGLEGGYEFPMGWKLHGAGSVLLGLGRYEHLSDEGQIAGYDYSDSGGVSGTRMHVWLGLGFRVTYAH